MAERGAAYPIIASFAVAVAFMAGTLAIMLALPHADYVRWQSARTEAYARLGWMYERIHDDPTPIDVALIGTSHTLNGVDGVAVARAMAAGHARTSGGRCTTVTNFAIPGYGRNIHWLIARELLATRRPKLLLIEIFENETRKSHPYFAQVATTRDILTAPALVNVSYLEDILRLPWRQVTLAVETLRPDWFGLKPHFDKADYDGSTVDNTRVVNVNGKALTPARDRVADPATLADHVARRLRDRDLHYLGQPLEDYEYAVPRRYLIDILRLADARHVPVRMLYLPSYGQSAEPTRLQGIGADRAMLNPGGLLRDRQVWSDPDHLNAAGASRLSRMLGHALAPLFGGGGGGRAGDVSNCRFGYEPRHKLIPFIKRGSHGDDTMKWAL